ncbi:hypothetical protein I317_04315 [Kwoniella heveanensis CBS 569]|uniref:GRF-type domain-containing protein n=1 Tax=Kwoniella heveanensis BCC8398 TaxID=1296120 RepID=A0A1B9GPF4_9TREE|nr:hypothetical protein I316_05307 [Kwoniella heveanensis BCC8398]OCF41905.1 hypothetical protein I317_04315 [Kwoniella heveanensis CBS 569]
MATRTRTSAKTRTMHPSRVQIQPSTPVDDDAEVKCSGHLMKCTKLRAGPTTKNAGRAFYCCPLPRDDPKRCKFFKWHDEIFPSGANTLGGPATPSAGGSTRAASLVQATNQTLGQSPQARYGRPLGGACATTSASTSAFGRPSTSTTTPTRPRAPVIEIDEEENEDEDELEEIDWDKVDAEEMERVAIASTPGSSQPASQRTPTHVRTAIENSSSRGTSLTDRLKDAAGDTLGKRSRDDTEADEGASTRTPKRNLNATESNPFISSPSTTTGNASSSTTPRSPPHSYLSPTLSSLEQLSEHLYRQDRLLRAAEQMKKGMRTTIKGLQDRNKELEDKVKELEKRIEGK